MSHKYFFPTLIVCMSMLLFCCAGTDIPFRPGYQVLNLTPKKPGKFVLKFGEKGLMRIEDTEYGFLLQSQNSTNSVRVVMEDSGYAFNLDTQIPQAVELNDGNARVRFKLSTIIRGSAVLYAYLDLKTSPPFDPKDQESDLVKVRLSVFQATSVILALDGASPQKVTLAAGSKVSWQAQTQIDILISEAQKVELEINGVVFQSDSDSLPMHKIVRRTNGKIVVESP